MTSSKCHAPGCNCIYPVPKPKVFALCEQCGMAVRMSSSTLFTELKSYGYYIGHHEKWVCDKCYKALSLEARNKSKK